MSADRILRQSTGSYVAAAAAIIGRDLLAAVRRPGAAIAHIFLAGILMIAVSQGFGNYVGRVLVDPYSTYLDVEDYLVPGLAALIVLIAAAGFARAQVAGRPSQALLPLLSAPLPVAFVIAARVVAAALGASLQAYVFVAIAGLAGVRVPVGGWLAALPAVFLAAVMACLVMLSLAIVIRQLRRLSTALLVVVLPAFFLSSSLYPLWASDHNRDALYVVALANPLTHAVELIRSASESQLAATSLAVVLGVSLLALLAGAIAVQPRWRLLLPARSAAVR